MYTVTFSNAKGGQECYPYITNINAWSIDHDFLECKTNGTQTFIIKKDKISHINYDTSVIEEE